MAALGWRGVAELVDGGVQRFAEEPIHASIFLKALNLVAVLGGPASLPSWQEVRSCGSRVHAMSIEL
jgi:hypothetical protein